MHQPIQDPESNNSVKFIRMSSGEDLLTEVIDIKEGNKEYFVFVNPMKLLYMMGKRPGSLGISLVQWVFPKICEKQEFTVDRQNITAISDASDKIAGYYWDSLSAVDHLHLISNQSAEQFLVEDGAEENPDELELLNNMLKSMKSNQKRTYH